MILQDEIKTSPDTLKTELSVSEISSRIRMMLEGSIGNIYVKGEISGLKIATSGHAYFNLKDSNSVLACVCWRGSLGAVRAHLAEGAEIVSYGKITAYGGQSKYQMIVESVRPSGIGSMMKILEERKKRLQQEGIFDQERKKPIPFMPKIIGVITSPTGAVLQDILHRLEDRMPSHVVICPATMQGESCAAQVKEGIEKFHELQPSLTEDPQSNLRPDLIIIARGGGSIEDLFPFNDEDLVRSVANAQIPIISAVGHETDFTLIDFAADLRAPTPTAAAEFASPVRADLNNTVLSHFDRIKSHVKNYIDYCNITLSNYQKTLSQFESNISYRQQRLDEISFKLERVISEVISSNYLKIEKYNSALKIPDDFLEKRYSQLSHIFSVLSINLKQYLSNSSQRLNLSSSLLASMNYKNVLKRGYTITRNKDGVIISSKHSASQYNNFEIEFFDGTLETEIKKS